MRFSSLGARWETRRASRLGWGGGLPAVGRTGPLPDCSANAAQSLPRSLPV